MSFDKKIEIANAYEILGSVHLHCSTSNSSVSIRYSDNLGNSGLFEGRSYFILLSKLRKIYNKSSLDLLCFGGLNDVYTSGLVSESSFGEMAYKIDERTGEMKIVNIFESISIKQFDDLVDISMQKDRRKRYFRMKRESSNN